jgi:putative Mn2+ efflux pump MntP
MINPLQNRGLLILSILTGINSFFVGLGFGLMSIKTLYVYYGIPLLITGILWGYFTGFTVKKLNNHRYEFFLGIIYIIIAIFIVVKG